MKTPRALRNAVPIALAALTSCVHPELDRVGRPRLSTHVDDWRDQVIYQLLTDRFANGDAATDHRIAPGALGRYQGGDYQGILNHLDYLETLGVTSLWISPIVRNVDSDAGFDAYHGYWAVDLETLNPHFGDLATLRGLVREAHARDMTVIVDIVTNHLGQVFYYDINQNGQPDDSLSGAGTMASPLRRVTEYDPDYDARGIQGVTSLGESGPAPIRFFDLPDIFRTPPRPSIFQDPTAYHRRGRVIDYGQREQVLFGDFPGGLKDLATEDPRVRTALVDAYVRWVLETDIDGFRIDTIKHVEDDFWIDFASRVRTRLRAEGKDRFFLFGEAFDGDDALIGSYTRPGALDSVFYFSQKYWVFQDVFLREGPTTQVERLLEQRSRNYGTSPQPDGIGIAPRDALVNFLDNHDVPRFLFEAPADDGPRVLRAALTYLFTEDGIPCLYYGTEQDFRGGNDPGNREPLWWSGYRTDGETFRHVARLSRIRRSVRALTRGSIEIRWATERVGDEEDAGILAFERRADEQLAVIAINTQRRHVSHTAFAGAGMSVSAAAGTTLVDLLSDFRVIVPSDQRLTLELEPLEARILVPESQRPSGL